ncbi:MAG: polyphosphate kinase 2 [Alphaproteobacteria bacterium]
MRVRGGNAVGGGQKQNPGAFDDLSINDPALPDWIAERAFGSGGYPYAKKMRRRDYQRALTGVQVELLKVQRWVADQNKRVVVLFEGRDAAGKGGTIKRFVEHLNPRQMQVVALPKPSRRERGEWYFQRYVANLPTAGEMTLFDRSWYNRAGVEPVLGFCTPRQAQAFLSEAPVFEAMLIRDGTLLFKYWLTIGREEQFRRLHSRRHGPLKTWKLSPIDLKSLNKWDAFTAVRRTMFAATDTPESPWTIVKSNDKKRSRINLIRHFLHALPYAEKDLDAIGEIDQRIVGPATKDMD